MSTMKMYCPHCCELVSSPLVELQNGKKTMLCPNCAAHFDPEWVREVNGDEAAAIIETRKPLGYFYSRERGDLFIGLDNSTGDAWTEEFEYLSSCIQWLAKYL